MIGKVLDGRYRILSLLGEGGMGKVYLAEHVILEKRMAVKVLHEEYSRQEEVVKRFQQEAIAASRIGQENIVNVTDFGRTSEGALFFVMEELEGESLASVARAHGALPAARALPILAQVCRALAAAHSRGIVHRDLKPENVVLVQREERPDFVKVLDFGISKVGTAEPGKDRLTRVGMIMGTPEYMAPEQAAGTTVDHRVDIYALGIMAYELFTGTLPFQSDNPLALLIKHQAEAPQPPRERRKDLAIHPEVEAFILKALAKRPEERQQSMAEVSQELSRCLQAHGMRPLTLLNASGPGPARPTSPTPSPSSADLRPVRTPSGTLALGPAAPELRPARTPSGTMALESAPSGEGGERPVMHTPKGGTMQLSALELRTPAPIPLRDPLSSSPADPVAPAPAARTATGAFAAEELAALAPRRRPLVFAGAAVGLLVVGVAVGLLSRRDPPAPAPLAPVVARPAPVVKPPEPVPVKVPAVVAAAEPPEPAAPVEAAPVEAAPVEAAPVEAAPVPRAPAPSRRKVALRSVPSGAAVFAGRERLGTTPFEVELRPGAASTYRFLLQGYRPEMRRVSAEERVVQVQLLKKEVVRTRRRAGLKDDPYGGDELKDDPFQ